MKYTKQDVLRLVQEEDVEFIRLQFTDIFGTMKNVAITSSQLEKALDNNCMFDGSSIEGFVRIEESDMYLYPDLDTLNVFPWRPHQTANKIVCFLTQAIWITVIRKNIFSILGQGHIDVHAGAIDTSLWLWHKACMQSMTFGDRLDCQLECHDIVCRRQYLVITKIDLVLCRCTGIADYRQSGRRHCDLRIPF